MPPSSPTTEIGEEPDVCSSSRAPSPYRAPDDWEPFNDAHGRHKQSAPAQRSEPINAPQLDQQAGQDESTRGRPKTALTWGVAEILAREMLELYEKHQETPGYDQRLSSILRAPFSTESSCPSQTAKRSRSLLVRTKPLQPSWSCRNGASVSPEAYTSPRVKSRTT